MSQQQPQRQRPFAQWALRHHDDGFAVGAVDGEKSAAAFGGVTRFETDFGRLVDELMPKFGHLNPAIRTDNVTVLDADSPEAVEWVLRTFPDAPVTITGRGIHLYLRGETRCRTVLEVAPGILIDVKSGPSAYVVAAGAVHASGAVYRYDPDGPRNWPENRPEVPDWLRRVILGNSYRPSTEEGDRVVEVGDKGLYVEVAVRNEIERMSGAREGNRNNQLNISAFNLGQLATYLDNEGAVYQRLYQAAQLTGLPNKEINDTLPSGWEAGKAKPRTLIVREGQPLDNPFGLPEDLPKLPTERNPDGPMPPSVAKCRRQALLMAKRAGGVFSMPPLCKSCRCDWCGPRKADRELRRILWYSDAGPHFGGARLDDLPFSADLQLQDHLYWKSAEKCTWVMVVPEPHARHRTIVDRLRKRAKALGADWLKVSLTDVLVVFATHDLSSDRASYPPDRAWQLTPAQAHTYLWLALSSNDVVGIGTSDGWEPDEPQTKSDCWAIRPPTSKELVDKVLRVAKRAIMRSSPGMSADEASRLLSSARWAWEVARLASDEVTEDDDEAELARRVAFLWGGAVTSGAAAAA